MNVEQLRKLRFNPYIAIGAHSVSHPALSMHSRELQNHEIHESKRWLENELHQTVDWFAFPFGNHNSITLEIVREIGFRGSVTTENKVVGSHSSPYTLGRYVVPNWPSDQLANFLFKAFKN
jgi:peptidoglycan/xylan/chitin deacetylase (PgdA/CDA1 family)